MSENDLVRNALLTDDEFLLSETKKLQTLYALKDEIRYNGTRKDELLTESVAEHIYAMGVIAPYFIALEDVDTEWDRALIYEMILYHDIDEIETGDTIGYLKDEETRAAEYEISKQVVSRLPDHIHTHVLEKAELYEKQETKEARFVRALDKIEPLLHYYNDRGKELFGVLGTTHEQHISIKDKYLVDFPVCQRFNTVISQKMKEAGFFTDS